MSTANDTSSKLKIKTVASALALAMACQPLAAIAQTTPKPAAPTAPPAGQYAPPPAGSEASGSTYDQSAQQNDRAYADQYSHWAAQNCIDQRNNTAAGAAIGGVLGAVLGSSVAGRGVARRWRGCRRRPGRDDRGARGVEFGVLPSGLCRGSRRSGLRLRRLACSG